MLEIIDKKFILVSSDIHDDEQALETLARNAENPNCLAFLYAGDLNIDNYFISEILRCRNFVFLPVRGNCDFHFTWNDLALDLPYYRTCSFNGLRIFISHGDKYYMPSSVGLEDPDYDLVITGHTHRYSMSSEIVGEKRITYLNPGSPSRPRGSCCRSYATIVFNEDKSVSLQLRALDGDGLLSEEAIPANELPVRNN